MIEKIPLVIFHGNVNYSNSYFSLIWWDWESSRISKQNDPATDFPIYNYPVQLDPGGRFRKQFISSIKWNDKTTSRADRIMERSFFFVSQVMKSVFLLLVLYIYSCLFSTYFRVELLQDLSLGNCSRQEMWKYLNEEREKHSDGSRKELQLTESLSLFNHGACRHSPGPEASDWGDNNFKLTALVGYLREESKSKGPLKAKFCFVSKSID